MEAFKSKSLENVFFHWKHRDGVVAGGRQGMPSSSYISDFTNTQRGSVAFWSVSKNRCCVPWEL